MPLLANQGLRLDIFAYGELGLGFDFQLPHYQLTQLPNFLGGPGQPNRKCVKVE
jgi:hypothetical protein